MIRSSTGATPTGSVRSRNGSTFALTAAAWDEPVSKTVAAAQRIAAKGKGLLAAYRLQKEKRAG